MLIENCKRNREAVIMSAPTMKSTSVLTEHLEYPPISLIDDIINAVNEIMYKCTQAMEKYLLERHEINGYDYTDEIRIGTTKLESLLENAVDKNFDKLELYVLRNVLTIPENLIKNNTFRLNHYKNVKLTTDITEETTHKMLRSKLYEIDTAFKLNEMLLVKVKETKRIHKGLIKFKQQVINLINCKDSTQENGMSMLKNLKPIDLTIKLLIDQLQNLYLENEKYCSNEQIVDILNKYHDLKNTPMIRSNYINITGSKVLTTLFPEQEQDNEQEIPIDTNIELETKINHPDWSLIDKFT